MQLSKPPAGDETIFLDESFRHGLQPLLFYWLHKLPNWSDWPESILWQLESEAKRQLLIDLSRRDQTKILLTKLGQIGVQALVLKGAAMGALHYPQPGLRPCDDTDLFIQEKDKLTILAVMKELGFETENQPEGRWISSQFHCYREDEYQILHSYDFHLKISNALLFTNAITFQELWREAVPVPALGSFAFAPSPAYLLLHSCIHRVAHHYDDDHAIWLYDIYLLAKQVDWSAFLKLAEEKEMKTVCLRGLQLAQQRFGDCLPAQYESLLKELSKPEASAQFLKKVKNRRGVFFSDLQTLSWQNQIRLIREHLFPPVTYMKKKYSSQNLFLLPFFYGYRIVRGILRKD